MKAFSRVQVRDLNAGRSSVYGSTVDSPESEQGARPVRHRGEWLEGFRVPDDSEAEAFRVNPGSEVVTLSELVALTGKTRQAIDKLVADLGGSAVRTRAGLQVSASWVRSNSAALFGGQ
jgi:hypothetical protein